MPGWLGDTGPSLGSERRTGARRFRRVRHQAESVTVTVTVTVSELPQLD